MRPDVWAAGCRSGICWTRDERRFGTRHRSLPGSRICFRLVRVFAKPCMWLAAAACSVPNIVSRSALMRNACVTTQVFLRLQRARGVPVHGGALAAAHARPERRAEQCRHHDGDAAAVHLNLCLCAALTGLLEICHVSDLLRLHDDARRVFSAASVLACPSSCVGCCRRLLFPFLWRLLRYVGRSAHCLTS